MSYDGDMTVTVGTGGYVGKAKTEETPLDRLVRFRTEMEKEVARREMELEAAAANHKRAQALCDQARVGYEMASNAVRKFDETPQEAVNYPAVRQSDPSGRTYP